MDIARWTQETDGPEAIKAVRTTWRLSQIAAAATRLLRTQGFHQMSVNALAKEAGISVGTIYQYVTTKEDILLLVLVDIFESYRREVGEAMEGVDDPVHRLAAGFHAYCGVVDSHRSATVLAYQESRTLAKAGREDVKQQELETNDLFKRCIDEAIEQGLIAEVDSSLLSFDLAVLAHTWALKSWHFHDRMSVEEFASTQLALVLGAVLLPGMAERYQSLLLPSVSGGAGSPSVR